MEPTQSEIQTLVTLEALFRWAGVSANDTSELLAALELEESDPIRILASLEVEDFRGSMGYVGIRGEYLSVGLMSKATLAHRTARRLCFLGFHLRLRLCMGEERE